MAEKIQLMAVVPEDMQGTRVDQGAAQLFPDYSRSRLQGWLKTGELTLDGKTCKAREKLVVGQRLELDVEVEDQERWLAEAIDLDVIYEDEAIVVLNKPAGLVVHPAAGNLSGTLLNALLSHYPDIGSVPRAGIVHRLDKDTTGLMVVAKTLSAQNALVTQLQAREVHREYEAVVSGTMTGGGAVDLPIGRHPKSRQKMAVVQVGGKEAITHYRLIKRYRDHTHIRCMLETGRTHQIRVHMAHQHHPLIGDPLYAGRPKLPKGASAELIDLLRHFPRQALHARRLSFIHPESNEEVHFESSLPEDILDLLAILNQEELRQ